MPELINQKGRKVGVPDDQVEYLLSRGYTKAGGSSAKKEEKEEVEGEDKPKKPAKTK